MLIEWYKTASIDFEFKDAVGILNVASCEQHSKYLPVGTDGLIGFSVAKAAAEKCRSKAILFPQQTVGYSPHHRDFKGYLTLSQETMFHYYYELCKCAFEQGLEKLIIVNSHGGNQSCLQTVVNELGATYDYRCILVRYWDFIAEDVAKIRDSDDGGMGHAGEFETSLVMYLFPELVKQEHSEDIYKPAIGNAYHSPDMFAGNKVYQYKPFIEYSPYGNIGMPQLASREKGKEFFERAVIKLADLIDFYSQNKF